MRACKVFILGTALLLLTHPAALLAEDSGEPTARRLINALGCKGCHKLEGDGGSLAPDLDQIGSRMSRDQIRQHLAAHAQENPKGFMPSYNTTSQEELTLISDFLYNLQ
ncbi:c-type cytochrome [Malonomonas rubra]|uniref:c-type cytochrome n=1 Tax=Malonomonas rubra TaxID=57040 RepID=UPI0026EB7892|nr:c-type cytochrome [Malonomonas rubra]